MIALLLLIVALLPLAPAAREPQRRTVNATGNAELSAALPRRCARGPPSA
jgi:hypothetical protein